MLLIELRACTFIEEKKVVAMKFGMRKPSFIKRVVARTKPNKRASTSELG